MDQHFPVPEQVAERMAAARQEQKILRRIYKLSLQARSLQSELRSAESKCNRLARNGHCATTEQLEVAKK